jgi:DNA-binding LacI/PurR family transcriptional regulator
MSRNRRRSQKTSAPTAPTIRQVAEQAGVSTATVSRVLAGADTVTEELSVRVRAAVSALNYRPNRIARSLRARTTRTIGVVIPDIQNPFFTSVVCGIEEVLQTAGYTLLFGNSDEDPARERVHLENLPAEGVAGIIFTPLTQKMADYQALAAARLPLVAIDRSPEGLTMDQVTVDNAEGARQAVAHLLDLGHRRIGLISGPVHLSTARERRAGYEQAFLEAGLSVPEDLIRYGDFRQAGGRASMRELLALGPRPTAVFVGNNMMTLGALETIHDAGLDIPRDISIVGFDNMPWATWFRPPLTTVEQPTREIGATAARLLLARLREPDRPLQHIILKTKLVVRASSGPVDGQR